MRNRFLLRTIVILAFAGVFVFCLGVSYRHLFVQNRAWPHDSLSIAINAECLSRLGVDEHGVRYPVVGLKTFGDNSPTMYAYCLALLFKVLPNTVQIAQFFSIVLALAFVAVFAWYVWKSCNSEFAVFFVPALSLFAFFSPWIGSAFQTPFEFTLCPLLVMLAFWRTDRLLSDPGSTGNGIWLGVLLGLMPYAHWGTKFYFALTLTVLPAVFVLAKGRQAWRHLRAKGVLLTYAVSLLTALPHIADFVFGGHSLSRANALAERSLPRIADNYAHFFNLNYLFLGPNRFSLYYSGFGGLLCAALLPLFLAGAFDILRASIRDRDPLSLYLAFMLPASFLPAALVQSQYYPGNIIRIVIAIPLVLLACARGGRLLYDLIQTHTSRRMAQLFLAVFILSGLPLTLKNAYLIGRQPDAIVSIPDAWNGPETVYDCRDHTVDSVRYRYFRLFERGDLRYCGCLGEQDRP